MPINNNRQRKLSHTRKRKLKLSQTTALNFEKLEDRQLLASVTVSNVSDVTNGNTSSIAALIASNGGDGISLREATIASNNTNGSDTISFAPAVFTGGSASVIRLTQGELVINEQLTIDGSTGAQVVITGDANNNDVTLAGTNITDVNTSLAANALSLDDNSRVINFSNSVGTLTLSTLTLTGGRTTGEDADGGGVLSLSGNVALINSTVSGNSTSGDLADGGGIHTSSGSVSLLNSTVSRNNTTGYGGYGGGVYSSSGNVSLTNSTLSDNSTAGINSDGGGIFTTAGNVTLSNSTVSGNSTLAAFSEGGGILTYSGNVSLTNSTLSSNRTSGYLSYGGGAYTSSGNVSLTNSTVTANSTSGGNSDGGGIFVFDGNVSIRNSIVAGNIVNNGAAPDLSPGLDSTLTVSHSLIGNTSGSGITASTGIGNILNQATFLGPLFDNGGPTLTHAPLTGSPAIDAGSNALAIDSGGVQLNSDQRGGSFVRIESGTVDIGAVEVQTPVTGSSVVSTSINEGGVLARPDLWNTLTVVFDSDVLVTSGDLSLFNDSIGGVAVNLSGIGFTFNASTNTAFWDFSTLNPLDAGFYSYQIDAGSNIFAAEHYVAIPGDANLDGVVNVLSDAFPLVASLGSTTNLAWANGNFNGDGIVNVLGDAFGLVANLGRDVRPPGAAFSSATALSRVTTSTAAQPLESINDDGEEKDALRSDASATASSPLGLAGAHDLRDDVFGSDF